MPVFLEMSSRYECTRGAVEDSFPVRILVKSPLNQDRYLSYVGQGPCSQLSVSMAYVIIAASGYLSIKENQRMIWVWIWTFSSLKNAQVLKGHLQIVFRFLWYDESIMQRLVSVHNMPTIENLSLLPCIHHHAKIESSSLLSWSEIPELHLCIVPGFIECPLISKNDAKLLPVRHCVSHDSVTFRHVSRKGYSASQFFPHSNVLYVFRIVAFQKQGEWLFGVR